MNNYHSKSSKSLSFPHHYDYSYLNQNDNNFKKFNKSTQTFITLKDFEQQTKILPYMSNEDYIAKFYSKKNSLNIQSNKDEIQQQPKKKTNTFKTTKK